MRKNIFTKKKRAPRKYRVLLTVFAGLVLIVTLVFAAIGWWLRPIVVVGINELSLNAEVEELNLRDNAENPEFLARAPNIYASLTIKIENIGRYPAEGIALNFLPRGCKLGKLYITKSDPDCVVEVSPSAELRLDPDLWPETVEPQAPRCYISIKELGPGSQVQIKYKVYREGEAMPSFKFGEISSTNARVKVFYYRR